MLLESDWLPAPARLALWLMWLRRTCGMDMVTSAGAGGQQRQGEAVDVDDGGTEDVAVLRGVPYWRCYLRLLPAPHEMTTLASFDEREAAELQVGVPTSERAAGM